MGTGWCPARAGSEGGGEALRGAGLLLRAAEEEEHGAGSGVPAGWAREARRARRTGKPASRGVPSLLLLADVGPPTFLASLSGAWPSLELGTARLR